MQYGVIWPKAFQQALSALDVLSFDLSMLGNMLCLWQFSFYQGLLWQTQLLLAAVLIIFGAYQLNQRLVSHDPDAIQAFGRECTFVAVYLLAFAYPVMSVKVVAAFACHEVNGVPYLRDDYNVVCYTSQWYFYAVYASGFVAFYVIGFPLLILKTLWGYKVRSG